MIHDDITWTLVVTNESSRGKNPPATVANGKIIELDGGFSIARFDFRRVVGRFWGYNLSRFLV